MEFNWIFSLFLETLKLVEEKNPDIEKDILNSFWSVRIKDKIEE